MLQALILAAGFGSRLRPLTDDRPKALVPVGGRPIVARALDALAGAGVRSVVVVTGHARAPLERYLAGRHDVTVTCVLNPAYAETNTLASVLCAAPALEDDFLLLDGDLVFEPAVLTPLLEPGNRLAVDFARGVDAEAVKVATEGSRVRAVGKTLPAGAVAAGESIGIARIGRSLARPLVAAGRRLVAAGVAQAYYEAAFQGLIDQGVEFHASDVSGLRWEEIDDHDDLARAGALFDAR
jgi:choline kinase